MKKLLLLALTTISLLANEAVNMEIMDYKNPYAKNENFPRDYLLVANNMPRLIKIIMSEPGELYLKPSQIKEITKAHTEAYNKLYPNAAKTKHKELELTHLVINEKKSFKDVEILLHEIAQLRIENTKSQIDLTNRLQEILDKGQYKKLLDIAKRWAR